MRTNNLLITLLLLCNMAAFAQLKQSTAPNTLVLPSNLNQQLSTANMSMVATGNQLNNATPNWGQGFVFAMSAPLDAGISSIINPIDSTTICDDPFAPIVVVENFGSITLTSATINYQINGGTISTFSWTGSLVTGATDTVTLPLVAIPAGGAIFTFTAFTSNPNGGTDAITTNDGTTVVSQYRTTVGLPYAENFGGGAIPTNITVLDQNSDNITWAHNATVNGYGTATGTGSLVMNNYSTNFSGALDWFLLPSLDMTSQGSAILTFDVAYARYGASNSDTLIVAINSDCGTTYSVVYRQGGSDLATAPDVTAGFVPTAAQWRTDTIDLSAYAGASHVRVAFINLSDYGQYMYIDNINVQGVATTVDAGISSITNPIDSTTICDDPFAPVVVVENFGTATLTSATINYQVNGGTISTFAWTGSLAPGATDTVTLPLVTIPSGGAIFTFTAFTSNPNGGTDALASNDATTVVSQYRATLGLPYSENFSGGAVPTNIRILDQNSDNITWVHNATVNGYGAAAGTGSLMMDNYNTNFRGALDWFILPSLDMTNQSNAVLTFDVAYARYGASNSDTLIVAVNSDCGTTYSVVYRQGGSDLATAPDATPSFVPTSTQWRTDTIDLSAYAGASHVAVAFINLSGYGQNMYIDNINVETPCNLVGAIASSNNVSCNGGNDGAVTVTATGGGTPYTYNIGTGNQATGVFNNLTAGSYVITITDNGSCSDTVNITISEPATIVSSSASVNNNVSCNGGDDGSATATATGGTGAYTYAWSNSINGATALGLSAGTYSVTATDANGCTDVSTVTISEPTAVSSSASVNNNVSCNGGNNGSATAAATGGTGAYTYAWSNSTNVATATGLSAGTYSVTATDANGCIDVSMVTISEPTAVSSSVSVNNNVSCNGGNDGSATASATGGTGAFSYAWSNSASGATASGLSAGTYSVTATDANGCTDVSTVTISEPTAVSSSASVNNNVSCNGGNDGSATVSATGGTGSFSYAWSNSASGATATGLSAGTYSVTATDANGCTDVSMVTISEPATAVLSSASVNNNVSCNGGNDGSATATATGGTGAYTYAWSNSTNVAIATGLSAGTYSVTATDANGCTDISMVTISEPTAVSSSASVNSNVSCNGGNDGSATATATGGTGAYTYAWSNSASGATATGLSAGTYSITATDANGCTDISMVTISEPTAVSTNVSVNNNVSCNGGNDGSVTAAATGGTGGYSYAWSNSASGATATGLSAGTYSVTATDANGCTDTSMVTVNEPLVLSAAITDNGNGTATAVATGGTLAYTYQWDASAGNQITATATGLVHNGTYNATITDANGCTTTANVTVNIVGVEKVSSIASFNIMPNPNTGLFQIDVTFTETKTGTVSVVDVLGKVLQQYDYSDASFSTSIDIQNQAAGVYFVVLDSDNQRVVKKVVVAK